MWTDVAAVCDRFSQLAFMAVIIFGSHAIARRAQDRRVGEEARRIRAALSVSLQALGELYRDNLRLLASGSRQLLSGRNQVQVLRIQLGRIVALLEGEIEAVLAANIALEAAETAMAVAGKPLGGVAFTVPADGSADEAVKQPLLHVCAILEAAQALLAAAAPVEPAREEPVSALAVPRFAAGRLNRWFPSFGAPRSAQPHHQEGTYHPTTPAAAPTRTNICCSP